MLPNNARPIQGRCTWVADETEEQCPRIGDLYRARSGEFFTYACAEHIQELRANSGMLWKRSER